MALQKEFYLKNGIKALYHRIKRIERNFDTITVQVACYTDKSYRDKEKEFLEIEKNFENIFYELEEMKSSAMLEDRELTDEEVSRCNELSQKLEIFENEGATNFEAFTHIVTLDYNENEDISFNSIYTKIKEIEGFDNAKDC